MFTTSYGRTEWPYWLPINTASATDNFRNARKILGQQKIKK
ncbi:Protein of unknown function [Bacillus cereus]|nr:Protein of unknown function [Bacillus cereus]